MARQKKPHIMELLPFWGQQVVLWTVVVLFFVTLVAGWSS